MNYAQLWEAIQQYSENYETSFVANIPTFVIQAEDHVYNKINIPSLRKNVTGNLTASNPYLSLPFDWLATYSLAIIDGSGNYYYALNKDVSFLRESFPNPNNLGLPTHYAVFGSQFSNTNEMALIVGPTPDQSYNVELHYFYYPPTIVQGVITTVNITNAGTMYTNGIYSNVPITGGSGQNATATITITNTAVASVTITNGGNFYAVGDALSFSASSIGAGTGGSFTMQVTGVSNATGTSWIGDNYDPVLLYGALREAAVYMRQEVDIIQNYENKFQEALADLKRLCDGLDQGDFYRNGQLKLNVAPKGRTVG
jgi:hypothetical protein